MFAGGDDRYVEADDQGKRIVFAVKTGERFGPAADCYCPALWSSADDLQIAVFGTAAGRVEVWSTTEAEITSDAGKPLRVMEHKRTDKVTRLQFVGTGGSHIQSTFAHASGVVFSVQSGQRFGPAGDHCPAAFTDDGQTAVFGMADGSVEVWSTGTPGQLLRRMTGQEGAGHTSRVNYVGMLGDGGRYVVRSYGRTLLFELETGNQFGCQPTWSVGQPMAWSADGRTVAMISRTSRKPCDLGRRYGCTDRGDGGAHRGYSVVRNLGRRGNGRDVVSGQDRPDLGWPIG